MTKTLFRAVFTAMTFVGLLGVATQAKAQTYTWSGGGAPDPNWSTTGNWDTLPPSDTSNTLIVLTGGTNTATVVDSNFGINSLTFNTAASAFTVGGPNTLSIGTGGMNILSGNANNQLVSTNLSLVGNQSWNNAGTGLLTVSGAVDTGANLLTVAGAGNTAISGVISGSNGFAKTGTGTLTLSGTNTYVGLTNITGGTLSISQDLNLGAAPGAATPGYLVIDNGATLSATASFTLAPNRGIVVGPNIGSGFGTINVASGQTLTYGGIIANTSGTGGLIKTGAGTLALGGVNTFTGEVRILGGVLSLAATSGAVNGATGTRLLIDNGTLRFTGTSNAQTFTAPRTITIGDGGGTIDVSSATGRLVYALGIAKAAEATGPVTLTKSGPGFFHVGAVVGFENLLVTGGYYAAGTNNEAIFSATTGNSITLNGGGIAAVGALNLVNRNISIGANGGWLGMRYPGNDQTGTALWTIGTSASSGGLISGNGNLTLENIGVAANTGYARIRLGKANTYTGDTFLVNNSPNASSLFFVEFSSGASFNPTGSVNFLSDRTTLRIGTDTTGVNQTFGALNSSGGNGTVTAASAATLTMGNGGGSGSYTGIVAGSLVITKVGTGTQAFSGANTYTGATNINGGTLLANTAGANSATGAGTVNVNNNGTLGGSGNALSSVNVNSGGRLMAGTGNAVNQTLTLGTTGSVTTFGIGSFYRAAVAEGSGPLDTGLTGASRAATQSLDLTAAALTAPGGSPSQSVNFELVGTTSLQVGTQYTRTIGTYSSFGPVLTGANVTSLNLTPGGGVTLTPIGFDINQSNWAIDIAGGNVIVTFTPVPEPTTILAFGTLAFGLVRRMRRK